MFAGMKVMEKIPEGAIRFEKVNRFYEEHDLPDIGAKLAIHRERDVIRSMSLVSEYPLQAMLYHQHGLFYDHQLFEPDFINALKGFVVEDSEIAYMGRALQVRSGQGVDGIILSGEKYLHPRFDEEAMIRKDFSININSSEISLKEESGFGIEYIVRHDSVISEVRKQGHQRVYEAFVGNKFYTVP